MNRVFREEKKFLISLPEALQISSRLSQVMLEDAHNGIHGYRIRSLYFDTIDDTDYYEKAAGVELRRKLRLRCYDPSADYAMLEMKQKQGASQLKRSLRVTREDAQALRAATTRRCCAIPRPSLPSATPCSTAAATAPRPSWSTTARRLSQRKTRSASPLTAASSPPRAALTFFRRS